MVDCYGIPHYGNLLTDMPLEFLHEEQNRRAAEICIAWKEPKHEVQSLAEWTHANGSDH